MNSATLVVLGVLLGVLCVGLAIFLAVLLFSIWSLRAAVVRLIAIVEPIAQQTSLPSMARAVVALADAGPGIGQHIQSLVSAVDKLQAALFVEAVTETPRQPSAAQPAYSPSLIDRNMVRQAVADVRSATPGTPKGNPVADAVAPPGSTVKDLFKLTAATDENSRFFPYDPSAAAAQEANADARKHGVELDETKGGPPGGETGAIVASA